ncbi:MAG: MFS transporter [archaeon]|nr:MFS transporter [archaeon]MDA0842691.1 MFS transporter [archaeon]
MDEEYPQNKNLGFFHSSQQLSNGLSTSYFAYHMRIIGGSVAALGILTAVAHVIPNILQPTWGKASDRSQKRVFWLVLGTVILAIGLLLMAMTSSPTTMLWAVVIHAVGLSMVTPVWNGLVTDMYSEQHRARAFARLGQIGLIANVVGSATAGLIVSIQGQGEGFARGFAFAGIINLIGLLVLFQLSKTNRTKTVPVLTTSPPIIIPPSADLHLEHPTIPDKDWKSYLHSQWMYILVMSIIWPLVPLTMLDVLNLSTLHIVVFVVVGQLSTLIWQPHVPTMLEKTHAITLIRRARLYISLIPIAYALVTFWPSQWGFWLMILIQIVYGHPVAVMNIAAPTVVSSASPQMERARRFGIHNAGIGIAALIGSSSAGLVLDAVLKNGASLTTILVGVYLLSTLLRSTVAWFGFKVDEQSAVPS